MGRARAASLLIGALLAGSLAAACGGGGDKTFKAASAGFSFTYPSSFDDLGAAPGRQIQGRPPAFSHAVGMDTVNFIIASRYVLRRPFESIPPRRRSSRASTPPRARSRRRRGDADHGAQHGHHGRRAALRLPALDGRRLAALEARLRASRARRVLPALPVGRRPGRRSCRRPATTRPARPFGSADAAAGHDEPGAGPGSSWEGVWRETSSPLYVTVGAVTSFVTISVRRGSSIGIGPAQVKLRVECSSAFATCERPTQPSARRARRAARAARRRAGSRRARG